MTDATAKVGTPASGAITPSGGVAGAAGANIGAPRAARAAGAAGLGPLFNPRGIAVVGASRSPGKLGAALARSLAGFAAAGGHLALVNERDETLYGSVHDAVRAGPVDLAMICVPAAACPGVLAEVAAAGVPAAVVCGGGFAEAGGPGAEYQRLLADVVAETGIRLLGPNTSGFLSPHAGVRASFVPGAAEVRPGSVAVVAASGGVNHALSFLLTEAGHGISLAAGLGNAVDVSAPDVLDHLADDPYTRAVALHVESVADGPRLVEAVRRLASRRPVVALVVGRHDIGAFAASHTGALATSWRTTRAALAQAGAVLVVDERELVDAVGALAVTRLRPTANPGVGVVTAQAGPGLLLLDDLHDRRARVPELTQETQDALAKLLPPLTFQRNPVDTGRPSPELGQILATVGSDPGVDILAAYALHEPDAVDLVNAAQQGRTANVPMVLGVGGTGPQVARERRALLAAGIAVAADPRGVATATQALLTDARAQATTTATTATSTATGAPPTNGHAHTQTAATDAPPADDHAHPQTALAAEAPPAEDDHAQGAVVTEAMLANGHAHAQTAAATEATPANGHAHARGAVTAAFGLVPTGVRGVYDEEQAKDLLDRLGIGTPMRRACVDRVGAHAALAELGGPVAVKILDAAIQHKTEVGGVHLGVRTPDALDAALDALGEAGARRYLVESMAPSGVDLVLGARRDPVFGPIVLLGLGGTAAEALNDVSIRLAPLTVAQATEMPGELAGHALLNGWRGGPVLAPGELAQVVTVLGDLLVANPGLDEIEINPLRLTRDGLVALDALIIGREADHAHPDQ